MPGAGKTEGLHPVRVYCRDAKSGIQFEREWLRTVDSRLDQQIAVVNLHRKLNRGWGQVRLSRSRRQNTTARNHPRRLERQSFRGTSGHPPKRADFPGPNKPTPRVRVEAIHEGTRM